MEMIETYSPSRHNIKQVLELVADGERIEELIAAYRQRALCVAIVERQAVGCIGFDATTGEIFHIGVASPFRGRHIARHLIEHITSRVLSPMLKATVSKDCAAFYEACGFMCEEREGKFSCYRVNRVKRCC